MTTANKIIIPKLDAGRRQLETAITLWFNDGDPVSIHTLACAAYEIIHVVSKVQNQFRRDLLFDSFYIKDEYRGVWNERLKKPANFFKHARNDYDGTLEFDPRSSEAFILFSLAGLREIITELRPAEAAYIWWVQFHRPDMLTEDGKKKFQSDFSQEEVNGVKELPKAIFLTAFIQGRNRRQKS